MPRREENGDGKKTTVSPGGLIKKTFWFHPDEVQVLRKEAYEQETTQAALVRAAVRRYFGMDESIDPDPGGDLIEQLRSDPQFRHELREFLQEFTDTPDQTEKLLSMLEGKDEQDPAS